MGLDMYLTKVTRIDSSKVTGVIALQDGDKPIEIDLSRVSKITEDIAYWRKANQVHQWFVDNCQGGVDDCGKYWVSHEKLVKLYKLCKYVRGKRKKPDGLDIALQYLPTSLGCFFGSQEYDDYYYSQLKDTMDMLKPYINLDEEHRRGCAFYYQSSW